MSNFNRESWEKFRESGMLWWINRILHTFGWAIVIEVEMDGPDKGKVTKAYPARVKFRGFGRDAEDEGYKRVSSYMLDNAEDLKKETEA